MAYTQGVYPRLGPRTAEKHPSVPEDVLREELLINHDLCLTSLRELLSDLLISRGACSILNTEVVLV